MRMTTEPKPVMYSITCLPIRNLITESAEAFGPVIQQQWLAVLSFPDAHLLETGAVFSHSLVFPVPKTWGYPVQTGCGLHSIAAK